MYRQIARNKRWSVALIVFFAAVVSAIGVWLSFGFESPWPLVVLVAFCGLYVCWQLYYATRNATRSVGGVEVAELEERRLHRTVENLAIRAGIPKPRVVLIDDDAVNAFAVSMRPNDAVVGATRGALRVLDDAELEAVVAHEISHITNYDGRVTATTFALIGSIAAVATVCGVVGAGLVAAAFRSKSLMALIPLMLGGSLLILALVFGAAAFILGPLINSGVSRQREYLADASAAELTRYPEALATALRKIEVQGSELSRPVGAASSFFFAEPARRNWLSVLLDSHPPTHKRIARLAHMAQSF